MQEQSLVLDEIKDQLDENNEQVRLGNALTSKIIDSLGLDWIRSLSLDIKKFMHGIFIATFATYHAVADIQGRLPSRLERCLYQEPFILEDCHGRVKPIYLDCITSWDAFDAWLEVQFRGLDGHQMVQERSYVLHDIAANKDILSPIRRRRWETAFLPGQRVVMCMLFLKFESVDCCLRCAFKPPFAMDIEIQW